MINPFLEIVVPYVAFAIFVVGVIYRIIGWARSAVPLKIPTTAGQAGTLPFIKRTFFDRIDSPYNKWEVVLRMIAEIFFFRSLFKNTRFYTSREDRLQHRDARWLWGFALLFHWSFLIILIRHLRFLLQPVPDWLMSLQELEAQKIFVPELYVTGITALIGLLYLLGRRLFRPKERTISLPSDYLALCLLLSIIITGLCMRYIAKVEIAPIKELALSLVTFQPVAADVHPLFLLHLTLVSITIAYFPFSKLMHAGGILFSPTRNMPNDNRRRRHVNPWNPPYVGITFEEHYENFRDQHEAIKERGYNFRPEVE